MKNIKDALIMDAIAFVQDDEKTMVLVMGDIVTIKTDGTKFKKEYKEVEIVPAEDDIWLDDGENRISIPYEYIEEIELIESNLE